MNYSTRSLIFSLGLVAFLVAVPRPAQARFGQRDDDSDTHRAAPAAYHGNSHRDVVVVESDDHHNHHHHSWLGGLFGAIFGHSHTDYVYVAPPPPVVVAPAPVYVAPPPPPMLPPPMPLPPPEASVSAPASPPIGGFGLGLTGQSHGEGATLGLTLRIEGRRFGINVGGDGIYARSERDRFSIDTIRLADAHLTYALIANEVLRVRLEGGVSGAIGDDLAAAGPDFGASARLRLVGPLAVEASSHLTPVPFRRFDARAALTLDVGVVKLQGGWRQTYLDDAGLLGGGERNVDRFNGPFAGIGLVF